MQATSAARVALVAAGFVAMAVGGENGITPDRDGQSCKFVRTDPPPDTTVAHGDFETGGGPAGEDTVHLNPDGGGPASDWDKGTDGQYRKRGGNGTLSICFHSPPSSPDTYTYKVNEEPVSSGEICP